MPRRQHPRGTERDEPEPQKPEPETAAETFADYVSRKNREEGLDENGQPLDDESRWADKETLDPNMGAL